MNRFYKISEAIKYIDDHLNYTLSVRLIAGQFAFSPYYFHRLFTSVVGKSMINHMYIIPTSAWRQESRAFVSHNYEGKKSKPDYGVNISKKNMPELEKYKIKNMLSLF